ncbi:hypothetical protein QYF53_09495 [Paenibacillus polymyxa]|nr:hypothetical protein [Paenibacillus polymyxa]
MALAEVLFVYVPWQQLKIVPVTTVHVGEDQLEKCKAQTQLNLRLQAKVVIPWSALMADLFSLLGLCC